MGTRLWVVTLLCTVRHSMSQHLFRLCYGVGGDGLKLFIFPHYQTCLIKEKWKADVKKGKIKADWRMKVAVPIDLIMYNWIPWRENNRTEEQCSDLFRSKPIRYAVSGSWHFGTDPGPRIRTFWLTDPDAFSSMFFKVPTRNIFCSL